MIWTYEANPRKITSFGFNPSWSPYDNDNKETRRLTMMVVGGIRQQISEVDMVAL